MTASRATVRCSSVKSANRLCIDWSQAAFQRPRANPSKNSITASRSSFVRSLPNLSASGLALTGYLQPPTAPNDKVKLRGRLVRRNVVESRNGGPVNFNALFGPAQHTPPAPPACGPVGAPSEHPGRTPFLRDHVPLQLNDSKLSR